MWRPVTRTFLAIFCGVCLFTATGCSLFRSDFQDISVAEPPIHLPDINEPPFAKTVAADPRAPANESPKADTDVPSCYVEIQADGKKPKRIRMSLDDATNVQAVLDLTGLGKKFKKMQIELSRKSENGALHKLEIHYDAKRKRVVSLFDYALHPNDLLVVREDSSSALDEMLKKLAGPLLR